MFILTNCTPQGNYTPSLFDTEKEAVNFSKQLFCENYISAFENNFDEEDIIELFCCANNCKAINICENEDLIDDFINFVCNKDKENDFEYTEKEWRINYSDNSFNIIEIFDSNKIR
mgnify:FL=1